MPISPFFFSHFNILTLCLVVLHYNIKYYNWCEMQVLAFFFFFFCSFIRHYKESIVQLGAIIDLNCQFWLACVDSPCVCVLGFQAWWGLRFFFFFFMVHWEKGSPFSRQLCFWNFAVKSSPLLWRVFLLQECCVRATCPLCGARLSLFILRAGIWKRAGSDLTLAC